MKGVASLVLGSAWIFLLAGCLVDPDDPCSEHQVQTDGTVTGCLCDEYSVANADNTRCVPCGDNERVLAGSCVCVDGYARPSASQACEPAVDGGTGQGPAVSSGEGESCHTDEDCAGYDASYCQVLVSPNVCLVAHCATGEGACTGQNICCIFPSFPPLAEIDGLCVPRERCLAPGQVVTP